MIVRVVRFCFLFMIVGIHLPSCLSVSDNTKEKKALMTEEELVFLGQMRDCYMGQQPDWSKKPSTINIDPAVCERSVKAYEQQSRDTMKHLLKNSTINTDDVIMLWSEEKGSFVSCLEGGAASFIELMRFKKGKSDFNSCLCSPSGVIAFVNRGEGSKSIEAMLTIHHWEHINWPKEWHGVGFLTEESIVKLKSLIEKRKQQISADLARKMFSREEY